MKGPRSSRRNHLLWIAAACAVLICVAAIMAGAQDSVSAVYAKQEIRVTLPSTVGSPHTSTLFAAGLETILHNRGLCCGKNAAIEESMLSNVASLGELGAALQGKHVLSDGRSVTIHADYTPQSSITSDLLISTLLNQKTPLIAWKSHYYVLYGAIYDKTVYTSGAVQYAIGKLLLWDPRFSDQRSDVEFNRATDDWGQVQGLLTVATAR